MRILRLLLVIVLFGSVLLAEEWKKDYTVGATPELKVDTNDARIEVRAGGAAISARVVAEGYKIGPSDVRISERQIDERVELLVRVPTRTIRGIGHREVRIEIMVPATTRVDLHTSDGSVSLAGTQAGARIATTDGKIEIRDFAGPLRAKSGDGSLAVSGRFTELDLQTNDGRIECNVLPGSQMAGRWYVRTGDGSVNLRLPKDLKADVAARTGDGHIHTKIPLAVSGTAMEHRIRGTMNGGGPILEIETGDGWIEIQ